MGLVLVLFVAGTAASDGFAYDAHAYWSADGYGQVANTPDAFLYSPPVLLVCEALGRLPWQVFLEGYTAAIALGVWILAGPWTAVVVWTPQVASEITLANVHVFLALVAVFGLRWPALWAFALLTKVTPGIGLLWFLVRGEWRSLGIALGVTAAIALPTMVLAPNLWADWITVLGHSDGGGTLFPRLALAAGLVALGAWRTWPALVVVAVMLAQPILWDVHGLSMLLGVVWWARRSPTSLSGLSRFSRKLAPHNAQGRARRQGHADHHDSVTDLEQTWSATHDRPPARWRVGPPTYDSARHLSQVVTMSPTPGWRSLTPPTYVIGEDSDERAAMRDLAERLT